MTHQAAPSFDQEYARVVKAAQTAQARADDFEQIVNACMKALTRAGIVNDAPLDQLVGRLATRLFYADRALADMVNQYMGFPEGYVTHEFMSAQEEAIDYLESIGWLRAGELERYYWTDAATDATKVDDPPRVSSSDLAAQLEETQRGRDELRARVTVLESKIDHYLAERDISDLMHDVQIQERAAARRWAQLWKRGMQAQMRARGYWRDEARRTEQECAELRASAALAVQAFRTCDQSRRAYVEAHRQSEARVASLRAALADILAGAEQQGESNVAATCRAAMGEHNDG